LRLSQGGNFYVINTYAGYTSTQTLFIVKLDAKFKFFKPLLELATSATTNEASVVFKAPANTTTAIYFPSGGQTFAGNIPFTRSTNTVCYWAVERGALYRITQEISATTLAWSAGVISFYDGIGGLGNAISASYTSSACQTSTAIIDNILTSGSTGYITMVWTAGLTTCTACNSNRLAICRVSAASLLKEPKVDQKLVDLQRQIEMLQGKEEESSSDSDCSDDDTIEGAEAHIMGCVEPGCMKCYRAEAYLEWCAKRNEPKLRRDWVTLLEDPVKCEDGGKIELSSIKKIGGMMGVSDVELLDLLADKMVALLNKTPTNNNAK